MFFDQKDLYLTFKFKIVTASTQIKAVFMHVNYNIINNNCLMGKNRSRNTADYVARHSKLYLSTVYSNMLCLVFKMTSLFF